MTCWLSQEEAGMQQVTPSPQKRDQPLPEAIIFDYGDESVPRRQQAKIQSSHENAEIQPVETTSAEEPHSEAAAPSSELGPGSQTRYFLRDRTKSQRAISVQIKGSEQRKKTRGRSPRARTRASPSVVKATETLIEASREEMKDGAISPRRAEKTSGKTTSGRTTSKSRACVACSKRLTWNYIAITCTLCHQVRCRNCLDCPCETPSSSTSQWPQEHVQIPEKQTSHGRSKSSKKKSERRCVSCLKLMTRNYRAITCESCKRERCRNCDTCHCVFFGLTLDWLNRHFASAFVSVFWGCWKSR